MESKINSSCLDVDIGTVVPLESSRGLISLNTGMKVINDWACFILATSQPHLREGLLSLFARGASRGKGQEGD